MLKRVEIKAEQIARMVVKGMTGTRIASEMGMSYDGLMRILKQPEYIAIEDRIRHGVTSKMDARLEKRAEMSDEVEEAVPEALQILIDSVKKKRDLKAALELLDRDPQKQFAKSKPAVQPSNPLQQPDTIQSSGLSQDALAKVIRNADLTHQMLQQSQTKPAEA